MVIMASGIARGRVRTTASTTVESRNMAAILQITGWQRDMQGWFTVYIFGIGYPCYDQPTPIKTRYPLTSSMWPYRGLKLTAHRGQVFFEVDHWPGAGFRLDRGLLSGWLVENRAGLFGKPVTAHPGLNVNQIITFSSMQMFLMLFCVYRDY